MKQSPAQEAYIHHWLSCSVLGIPKELVMLETSLLYVISKPPNHAQDDINNVGRAL